MRGCMRGAQALLALLLPLSALHAADVAIVAGENHGVFLDAGGRIWSWGANGAGQLGNQSTTGSETPVASMFDGGSELSEFISVSAGGEPSTGFTVAVRANGTVWTWGDNTRGQLGNLTSGGSVTGAVQLCQYGGSTFAAARMLSVSAGRAHVVALRGDGTVWTWGDDTYGQCGQGTSATFYNGAKQVAGLTGVIAVAAGGYHSLALKADGTVWSWGQNDSGELGDDSATQRTTPVQVKTGASTFLGGITAVSAGYQASMALAANGQVYCWGADNYGQIGDDTALAAKDLATVVPSIAGARAIACGMWGHKLALTYTGRVYGWGYNGDYRMGYVADTADQPVPVTVYGSGVRAIAAGRTRSLFVLAGGEVQQAGNGVSSLITVPAQWPLSAIQRVAAGGSHTLALKADGTVWAWGSNGSGQLGIGTVGGSSTSPVQVLVSAGTPLTGVVAIEAGASHAMALTSSGVVYCWGSNGYGQCGTGTIGGNQAYAYAAYSFARSIACGALSSYAVYYGGHVASWGYNGASSLGDGGAIDNASANHYVYISSGTYLVPVRALGAGSYHVVAIKSDGTGVGWGYNPYGQLGNASTGTVTYATAVSSGLSGLRSITGGMQHTLWNTADGKLYAAGYNGSGQFGNGATSTTAATTPAQVATSAFSGSSGLGVRFVVSGYNGGYGVRSDGVGFGWGSNSAREAGVASATDPIVSPAQFASSEDPLSYEGRIWHVASARSGSHGALVTKDGVVRCWGGNGSGQLGNGGTDASATAAIMYTTTAGWLPSVTVTASDPTATEAGPTTGTFTITRTLSTAGSLSVGLSAFTGTAAGGDISGTAPTSVTIPGGSASTTVTVTPADDSLDEDDETVVINLAAGTGYQLGSPTTATITVADNDTAGFTVSGLSGTPTEAGGAATFTVRLNSQPTASVTISLSSSNTAEGTVSPASLTFTVLNWSIAQTVTVTGVNDAVDDGNVVFSAITSAATSSDTRYAGLNPSDVSCTNQDNDTAGITVGYYYPQLRETPLTLTSVSATSDKLIFAPGTDLSTVTAGMRLVVNDNGTNNGGNEYAVYLVDDANDVVYIDGSFNDEGPEDVTFGDATWMYIKLDSQPTSAVTIGISSGDSSEGAVGSTSVTIQPAGWGSYYFIPVSPVDDQADDGDVAWTAVTATASSSDPLYNVINPADVSFTTVDDDTSAVVIAESAGGTAVTESGGTDTYTVRLATQPTASVTVAVSPNAQVGASPTTLTFTSANWNTPQTVTVTAVDDSVDEADPHAGSIAHNVTSGDASYTALTNEPSVSVSVSDNDAAGFSISPLSGLTMAETGGSAVFNVKLNSQPTAVVSLPLSSSDTSEGTVSAATLYFGPSATGTGSGLDASNVKAWNSQISVTVSAVSDQVDDGNVAFSIVTGSPTSADPNYNGAGANPSDVSLTCIDDDTAAIIITETGGSTAVAEGGATDTYTVKLGSQPTGNVTVTITGTQVSASPTPLTFTTANWATGQTVTVSAVQDSVAEGAHSGSLGHAASAAGGGDGYTGGSVTASLTVSVADDDAAGVSVTESGGSTATSESGTTDSIGIKLTSQPTASVTIPVSSSNTAEGTVSPASLTFTTGNWNVVQTVTATGVDDAPPVVDGNGSYSIVLGAATSTDTVYAGLNPADVSALNADNDAAGVVVSAMSGSLSESGTTATYTVQLATRPTANVTVTIMPNGQQTVSPTTLSFTPTGSNWSTAQTVTVTAVDDPDIEAASHAGSIAHDVTAGDAAYLALSSEPSVTTTILDNDSPGIVVTPTSGLTTTEAGGTAAFTVVLATRPTADVTIALSSGDTSEGTVAPASLTFTASDWNVPQAVTITGVDDLAQDNDVAFTVATAPAVSGDGNYGGLDAANVTVTNVDDDVAGVTILPLSGLVTSETGSTATFWVRLNTAPSVNVSFSLTSSNTAEGTVSPASLTFTPSNYGNFQAVTVTGVNDTIVPLDDGGVAYSIQTGVISAPGDANGYDTAIDPPDVSLVNQDDDTAAIVIAQSGGSTLVGEEGATDTYTVVLATKPTASVTVAIDAGLQLAVDADAGTAGDQTSVVFTTANWNLPRTVTVRAIDDDVDEAAVHAGSIAHSATGGGYGGVSAPALAVAIADDDAAGISVGAPVGTISEAGGSATLSVVLLSQPTGNVSIPFSSSDTGEGVVSPASLVFTPGNWNVAQLVTVTGVDDQADDGDIAFSAIVGAATSADPNYSGLDAADRTATCVDNDSAGVAIVESGGSTDVAEGSSVGDTYTVVLTTQPSADVVVTPSPATGVSVAPASLTFTSGDWNVPQTVTVTAVDNQIDQASPHAVAVAHAASGEYAAVAIAQVLVQVADDDTAAVVVTASDGVTEVAEGGATDTYTVVLSTEPTAPVTITVSGDAQATAAPATLVFTGGPGGNWAVPQTVTVTAVDDSVDEAAVHAASITHAASGGGYDAVSVPAVAVGVADNDTVGVLVTPASGLTLTEGGAGAFFAVQLAAQPASPVTITCSSQDLGEADLSGTDASGVTPGVQIALVFTAANWSQAQLVQVVGVDDHEDDGDQPVVIATVATSADPAYAGINVPDVTCTTVDDDTVGVLIAGSRMAVTEGGSASGYTIRLASSPTSAVQVAAVPDAQVAVSPAVVWFAGAAAGDGSGSSEANARLWSDAAAISVTAVDDDVDEGDDAATTHPGSIGHTAVGGDYTGVSVAEQTVTVTDNDTAGFVVTQLPAASRSVREQLFGFASFLVSQSAASATGMVQFPAATDLSGYAVGQAVYLAQQASWTVILAIDDAGDRLTLASVPADSTGESLLFASGFKVRLSSRPTSLVIASFSSDDASEGYATPASVTFTPDSWNVDRVINMLGADDDLDDGDIVFTCVSDAAFSADAYFNGLVAPGVAFTSVDDESSGVTVTPVSGLAVREGGTSDSFSVVLDSEPTATVSIAVSSADPAELAAAPAVLVFTPANWSTPQTVTVTGADGDGADNAPGGETVQVVLGAPVVSGGSDAGYAALTAGDVPDVDVLVLPSNAVPSIDTPSALGLVEDDAPVAIGLTGIGTGQSGESQSLVVSVSIDNADLADLSTPAAVAGGASSFTITPRPDASGTATVTVTVTDDASIDGTAQTVVTSFVLTIAAANDPAQPDLDGDGTVGDGYAAGTFTEGDPALAAVDSSALQITDVDHATASSVHAALQAFPDGSSEILAVSTTGFPFLTSSYNPATGTLTVAGSGPQPISDFQTVLRTLTYRNTSDHPTAGTRTIAVTVDDGAGDGPSDASTVTVAGVNDAPTLDLDGDAGGTGFAAVFSEGAGAVAIADALTLAVADPDSAGLVSATITWNAPDATAETVAMSTAGLTAVSQVRSDLSGTATLTITAGGSVAAWQAALRTLTYDNASDAPSTAVRSIVVAVSDGLAPSNDAIATVSVTAGNDAPVLDLNGPAAGTGFAATYVEDAAPVAIVAASLVLSDADSVNLANGATAVITNLIDVGSEVLAAPGAPGGITVAYTAATGTLSLSGVATVDDYRTALRSLTYANQGQSPNTAARSILVTVNDGAGGVASATATVAVTAVNDAPNIDLNGPSAGNDMVAPATFTEDQPAQLVLVSGAIVSDPDSTTIASATITLQNHPDGDGTVEVLAVNADTASTYGITVSWDAGTCILSLSGSGDLAEYQQLISTLVYENLSQTPTGGASADRTVGIVLSDGTDASSTTLATVRVAPVNDTPVLSVGGSTTLALGGLLPIRFADGSGATATATVSGGVVTAIAVDASGTGYVSPPRVMITGGGGSGAEASSTLLGGGVDTVVVGLGGSGYATAPAVSFAPDALVLAASDSDTALGSLTYTVLLTPNLGRLMKGAAQISNSDTFTVADLQAGLMSYQHNGTLAGADGFAVRVDDGSGGQTVEVVTLNIAGLVPPQLAVDDATPAAWIEGSGPVQLDSGAVVTDTDSANFGGGSIRVDNPGGRTGDRIDVDVALAGGMTRSGNILSSGGTPVATLSGGDDGASLVLTLTASCSPAVAQALVRGLTWANVGDDPATDPDAVENRVLDITVNDGFLDSAVRSRTIAVDPVDDPPVLASYRVSLTPGLTVSGQLVASDPEGEAVTFALGTPLAGGGLVTMAADGSFSYSHQDLSTASDTFGVQVTEAGAGGQTTTGTVTVQVTQAGASAPRIVSAPPVRAQSGVLFVYTPQLAGFGANLTYTLVPALQEAVSGTDAPGGYYTFSGGSSGSGATGTLRIPIPAAPADGGGYLRTGILVIDQDSGAAAYQPLLIKIAPGAGG